MTFKNLSSQKQKIIAIVVFILLMALSVGFSFKASELEFYSKTIEVLDENKAEALALSTSATAVAIGVSVAEVGEPIADILTNIASYAVLITTVIFLEKFLLTTIGIVAFRWLIPIACLLAIAFILSNKETLKNIAIKLVSFGLILAFVIPVSTKLGVLIEETHKESFAVVQNEIAEEVETDKGFWEKLKNKTNELKEKATKYLNYYIDSIAVMLITICLIPIGVLAFMLWIIKIIFGVNIGMPDPVRIKNKIKTKVKRIEVNTGMVEAE